MSSITGCIESESSLDDMDKLCHRVTQYIFEGHCLDSDTKKNMRPLLEKCLSNRWYQQFQNLSHLVYRDDPMWSNEPSYNLAGAWNAVALLDSEAEVLQLQKELSTDTHCRVSDMAKALVRTMERASNSEENAHMLEAKVENAVVKAAEAGVAAAGATESASEAARLAFRAIDGIRAVENTVTSQGDRIDRLEEHALNNLSPDILQLIKIVSSELDLANALAEVTDSSSSSSVFTSLPHKVTLSFESCTPSFTYRGPVSWLRAGRALLPHGVRLADPCV